MAEQDLEAVPVWLSRLGRRLAPLILAFILVCPPPAGLPHSGWRLIGVTLVMSLLWFTQGLDMAVTSLIPLFAYPLLGIQQADEVSKAYIDANIWLYVGGFIIALGIERWGLHRRLALWLLYLLGTGPRTIVLGFMLGTGFISMWISNTASTMMMLPIALALLVTLDGLPQVFETHGGDEQTTRKTARQFGVALVLGIAYAASIGGVATPIGTPANVAFLGIWKKQFPLAPPISTAEWMLVFVPVSLIMLLAAWLVLTWQLPRGRKAGTLGHAFFRQQLDELGPMRFPERAMLVIFLLTALLWMFRGTFRVGEVTLIWGWADMLQSLSRQVSWLPEFKASLFHDSTVAMGMAFLTFCIPAGKSANGDTQFLMDWQTAERLPWGLVLLFGGGFAMAGAFDATGLSAWLGQGFSQLIATRSPLAWVFVSSLCLVFLTEFASNVATVNMFLPILASVAVSLGFDPRLLLLPATIAASLGFMLPAGTPPNAIAFGTGRVRMDQMATYGCVLNCLGIVVVTGVAFAWMIPVMGINLGAGVPEWALPPAPPPAP